jgi:hypothetical protein
VIFSKDFLHQERKKYIFSKIEKSKTLLCLASLEQFDYVSRNVHEYMIDYKFIEETSLEIEKIIKICKEYSSEGQSTNTEVFSKLDFRKLLVSDPILDKLKDYTRFQEKKIFRKLEEKVNDDNFNGDMGEDGWQYLIPGSLRKTKSFLRFLKRFLAGVHSLLNNSEARFFSLKDINELLANSFHVNSNNLKFAPLRFKILKKELYQHSNEMFRGIKILLKIGEILSSENPQYKVLVEPSYDRNFKRSPMIFFFLIDYVNLTQKLISGYKKCIIGSLCLGNRQSLLKKFSFFKENSQIIRLFNKSSKFRIFPFLKHSDQTIFRTNWKERTNSTMNKHFGNLLVSLSKIAPDGMIVIFPDFQYIEQLVSEWSKLGIIDDLCKRKLVFIDAREREQNKLIYNAYLDAISKGRGGVLFTNYESNFLKGIKLTNELCKTCVFFGLPFDIQNFKVKWIQQKLLQKHYEVKMQDEVEINNFHKYLQFMRECVEDTDDSCCFVIADIRYSNQKIDKMPKWMLHYTECNEMFNKNKLVKNEKNGSARHSSSFDKNKIIVEEYKSDISYEDNQEHWGFEISEGLKQIRKFFINHS